MTQLLLPPARYQLCLPLPRVCCIKAEMRQTAQDTINAALDSFRKALAFLESLHPFRFSRRNPHYNQPCVRYARAGSPYGRNQRSKKRWLLEQKRRARS